MRIFSFEDTPIDLEFWESKIYTAYHFRETIGLTNNDKTDVYRLVFAEGDGLPGLVIDVYGETAVLQAHTIGMYRARHEIAQAIINATGDKITAVYDKSAESLSPKAPVDAENGYLIGDNGAETIVQENGNKFYVDWVNGQKTGFFVDQRENRELVAKYSQRQKSAEYVLLYGRLFGLCPERRRRTGAFRRFQQTRH